MDIKLRKLRFVVLNRLDSFLNVAIAGIGGKFVLAASLLFTLPICIYLFNKRLCHELQSFAGVLA